MKKEEIELGMVFRSSSNPEIEYVVINIYDTSVLLERVTCRSEGNNRHGLGYGWFEHTYTKPLRKMDEQELARYIKQDPICNLQTGIYRLRKDILDMDSKILGDEGEIIDVSQISCEKSPCGDNFYLEITYKRFGYVDDVTATFYEDTKIACIHFFWRILKKINTN